MGDENSIANETFTHAVSVFESAWVWCVKNDSRFNNEDIYDIVGRMINAHEREVHKIESERDEEHDKVNWLHAELKDLEERSIELPKDAFGEPIRVGDVIKRGVLFGDESPSPFEVCIMRLDENGWEVFGRFGDRCHPSNTYHHHRSDTWERIIEDAVNVHGNGFNPCWTDERDALVARCHVLAGDAS